MSSLPPELWRLIIEQLPEKHLPNLRLVSRRFDDLAAPYMYQNISLSNDDITRIAAHSSPRLLWMLGLIKHVTFKSEVDWVPMKAVVERMKNLQSIMLYEWNCCIPDSGFECLSWLYILQKFVLDFPDIEIGLEGDDWTMADLRRAGFRNVSTINSYTVRRQPHPFRIERHIMEEPTLKRLEIICDGPLAEIDNFQDIDLSSGIRVPPLSTLILKKYDWRYSAYSAVTYWDCTIMTHLELHDMCLMSFLQKVPPHHLLQLRTLILENSCDICDRYKLSDLILTLVDQIRALETLGIMYDLGAPIAAITKHSATLRSLNITDSDQHDSVERKCLSTEKLQAIQNTCKNLMELSLDVNIDSYQALTILAGCRNLRRLAICAETHHRMPRSSGLEEFELIIKATVKNWTDSLTSAKQGAKFEMIKIELLAECEPESEGDPTLFQPFTFQIGGESNFDASFLPRGDPFKASPITLQVQQ